MPHKAWVLKRHAGSEVLALPGIRGILQSPLTERTQLRLERDGEQWQRAGTGRFGLANGAVVLSFPRYGGESRRVGD